MARPSEYISWVPGGSASYIADPPVGQKNTGWTSGEKPPFRYMNWLFYTLDQWIQWIDQSGTGGAYVIVTSGPYTVTAGGTIFANPTSGTFTINLPSAVLQAGLAVTIKNTGLASGNVVNIAAVAGNIEGGAASSLSAGDVFTFKSDGTDWWQVA